MASFIPLLNQLSSQSKFEHWHLQKRELYPLGANVQLSIVLDKIQFYLKMKKKKI